MKTAIKKLSAGAVLFTAMLLPSAANACSVCMGGSDSTIAPAANGAIFFMFGAIGLVLSCLAGFIFHLARRARLSARVQQGLTGALAIISKEELHA